MPRGRELGSADDHSNKLDADPQIERLLDAIHQTSAHILAMLPLIAALAAAWFVFLRTQPAHVPIPNGCPSDYAKLLTEKVRLSVPQKCFETFNAQVSPTWPLSRKLWLACAGLSALALTMCIGVGVYSVGVSLRRVLAPTYLPTVVLPDAPDIQASSLVKRLDGLLVLKERARFQIMCGLIVACGLVALMGLLHGSV